MDKNTLRYLINSMKSFAIFLTNFFKNTLEKSDYILEEEYSKGASFALSTIIFLSIKEDLISGSTNNYEIITLRTKLLNSLKYICKNKNTLDNRYFDDPSDTIGLIRNKLAHGNFVINNDNTFSIFKENDEIKIDIDAYIKFASATLRVFYESVKNDTFERKIIRQRLINSLNTKGEIVNFLRKSQVYNFKLRRFNGNIEEAILNKTHEVIDKFLESNDLGVLMNFASLISGEYSFTWESLKKNDDVITKIAAKCYDVFPNDMDNATKARFASEALLKEYYKETKFNLVESTFKDLLILEALRKEKSINKELLIKYLRNNYGNMSLSIREIAAASITLFNAMFSYCIDYELQDLPYDKLYLSKLDILFYKHNNPKKEELITRLKSKLNDIKKVNAAIERDNINLENVLASNNQTAQGIISAKITNKTSLKNTLQQDIHTICKEIGKISIYENANQMYIKNKDIVNGIRNSIAHGNVFIDDDYIYFKDIYEGIITFACKVNIVDLLNMLYENIPLLNEYLNKEDVKCLK